MDDSCAGLHLSLTKKKRHFLETVFGPQDSETVVLKYASLNDVRRAALFRRVLVHKVTQ